MVTAQQGRHGRLRFLVAKAAVDPHGQPQHVGRQGVEFGSALYAIDKKTGPLIIVPLVIHPRQEGAGARMIGFDAQGVKQVALRCIVLLQAQAAGTGIEHGGKRRLVDGILDGRVEIAQALGAAAVLAQKAAVVIREFRIVGRQAQGALEALVSQADFTHLRIDQAAYPVSIGKVRIDGDGLLDFIQRNFQLVVLEVADRQLQADRGALFHIGLVGRRLDVAAGAAAVAGAVAATRAGAGAQQQCQRSHKARAQPARVQEAISTMRPKLAPYLFLYSSIFSMRSCTRVRSCTSPASWPQAASMSSPRVLRIVVTRPPSSSTWAKALMRGFFERSKPDSGKGLKGIRLNLQDTPTTGSLTSASSSRACSSLSLTPSSMQYSKVMKSRGANSR